MASDDVESVDLLIVGSGAAGLTAALVGAEEGLRVLVVESATQYGGTTSHSGGVLWVANNPLMKSAGLHDDPEQALDYLRHNVGNRVAPEKLEALVEHAPRMVEYLIDRSGLRFGLMPDYPDYAPEAPGGMSGGRSIEPLVFSGRHLEDYDRLRKPPEGLPQGVVGTVRELTLLRLLRAQPSVIKEAWKFFPRNLWNRIGRRRHLANGVALIARLRHALAKRGVPLWLDSPLVELVMEDGRVTGAIVERRGQRLQINAKAGVVIAAGGFDRNPALRAEHFNVPNPDWLNGTYSAGSPDADGSAILAGKAAGAALDLMDDMWWIIASRPPGSPTPTNHLFERALPHSIIVNADGRRFANEAAPYSLLGRHLYENRRPPAFFIFDQTHRSRYPLGTILPGITPEKYFRDGYIKRANTLDELAALLGIVPAALNATVARFNAMAREGQDKDFGRGESSYDRYGGDPTRQPNPCLGPIETAPFHAIAFYPGELGTKGGLLTNAQAQVLDAQSKAPISGLYAAGNASACVVGHFYPGAGGTIGPAMTYAYIAARHAAANRSM